MKPRLVIVALLILALAVPTFVPPQLEMEKAFLR
jgi:hypothetical protein